MGCKTTRSTWQSVKQVLWRTSFMAVTFTSRSPWRPLVGEILNLEWEEGSNHDKFAVFSSTLLSLAMFLESFHRCFGKS